MDITNEQQRGGVSPKPGEKSGANVPHNSKPLTLLKREQSVANPATKPVIDSVELSRAALNPLRAGVVGKAISFDEARSPRPAAASPELPSALPMYRNPAVKNSVATEIAVGRILDAQA